MVNEVVGTICKQEIFGFSHCNISARCQKVAVKP